jgi:chemotaxis signal transduction protein
MLTRRIQPSLSQPVGSLAVLELGGVKFALPAADILEIVRLAAYTPVPCEDPALLGIVLHRDGIVPFLDLGTALGAPPRRAEVPGLSVVVKTPLGRVAFAIDRILGVEVAASAGLMKTLDFPGGLTVLRPRRW